jgi:hypothetical protein
LKAAWWSTGDARNQFIELSLFDIPKFDTDGPVLIKLAKETLINSGSAAVSRRLL